MNRRRIVITCSECQTRFNGPRNAKYCGDLCKAKVKKRRNAEYERRVKRPPHLYRKKKAQVDEVQLELNFA